MNTTPSPSMPVAVMTTRRKHGNSRRRYHRLSPEQCEKLEGDFAATESHIRKAARRYAYWSGAEINDLVRLARTKLVDSLTHPMEPLAYPATTDDFRSLFLTMLRRSAVDLPRPRPSAADEIRAVLSRPVLNDDHEEFLNALETVLYAFPETLPPKQESVCRDWLVGRARQEIADLHGISIKTVDNQMEVIVRKLREFLVFAAEDDWQVPAPTPRPGQRAVPRRTSRHQRTRTLLWKGSEAADRLEATIRGLASRHAKRTAARRAKPT